MAALKAPYLYQETRLNLQPAFPESTVEFALPSAKRRRINRTSIDPLDEETFLRNHLASDSSIHFRPPPQPGKLRPQPRAVLWRILEAGTLLELQGVDLSQDRTESAEPLLTLRFQFPGPIQRTCLAFAEGSRSGKANVFCIFLLTTDGKLHTLTLGENAFVAHEALGDDSHGHSQWYNSYVPVAFGLRKPVRLFARSDTEIWLALGDGGLSKLERKIGEDGTKWRETSFTESRWKASVRGLIPWGDLHTRYGDSTVNASMATSMAISPDDKHVWTVCLDHKLKAWNISTGKVVVDTDLVDDKTANHKQQSDYVIDPSQDHLLQVLPGASGNEYMIVVFSPKTREFKFWTIRDADLPTYGIEDARPDMKLVPPIEDMANTTIWSLNSFHCARLTPKAGGKLSLWIMVRMGTLCQAYNISFDLDDHAVALSRAWKQSWIQVDQGSNTTDRLKQQLDNPGGLDAHFGTADRWIDYIFTPGRFTLPTLETALTVYQRSLGSALRTNTSVVGSSLDVIATGSSDHQSLLASSFTADILRNTLKQRVCKTVTSWPIFYGVLQDLHRHREVSLSLVLDSECNLAWLVMADSISPLRSCSAIEQLWLNWRISIPHTRDNSRGLPSCGEFLSILTVFRDIFPRPFLIHFRSILQPQMLQGVGSDVQTCIVSIYDRSGLHDQVTQDDYDKLTSAVDCLGGWSQMHSDVCMAILQLLGEAQHGNHQDRRLTRYGARLIIRGSQETLQIGRDVLLDLILFVVFVAADFEEGDIPENFDASAVFVTAMEKAREYELLSWMASTSYQTVRLSNVRSKVDTSVPAAMVDIVTSSASGALLEELFMGDWHQMRFPDLSQPALLTYSCRAWTFGLRLSSQYDQVVPNIMALLLKHGNTNLAFEILQFLPQTVWSTYLRGRLFLARSEAAEAAWYFEDAARDLVGSYFELEKYDTAGLLQAHEREHFKHETPHYYQHIIKLFEQAKCMSYVADFAKIALHEVEEQDDDQDKLALQADLLSSLFNACIQTSRYEEAFSALSLYPDLALRKRALDTFLTTILMQTPSQLPFLLSLAIQDDIAADIDAYLESLCTSTRPTFALGLTKSFSASSPGIEQSQQFHKVLYAWRIKRSDFRGAANCLWNRLQVLNVQGQWYEGKEDEIHRVYLALMNVLSLMHPDDAWILVRPLPAKTAATVSATETADLKTIAESVTGVLPSSSARSTKAEGKRKIITLTDIRRMWQEELDNDADIQAGRFPLSMDIDVGGVNGGREVDMLGA